MLITSASNEKIKNIKKLIKSSRERYEQAVYIVEGIRMFREIPIEDVHSVFISENGVEKYNDEIITALGNEYQDKDNVFIVSDKIFGTISDTETPQGILALVKMKKISLKNIIFVDTDNEDNLTYQHDEKREGIKKNGDRNFILIIEKLQDPGNLGTIIRTAEGAGVTGIIISSDSVDIYNPKVVRSTMGSIFRVPIYVSNNLTKDIEILKAKGITIYGAHLKGENIYNKDFKNACAFLIGNEGNGLSDEISETADELIKIPMMGKVESLNAATSTAVICYEVLRQRL